MSEMIERVAQAIASTMRDWDDIHRDKKHWRETQGLLNEEYRDINDWRQDDYLSAARAAIEAMREPTKAMFSAFDDDPDCPDKMVARGAAIETWVRMIDKALAPQPKA